MDRPYQFEKVMEERFDELLAKLFNNRPESVSDTLYNAYHNGSRHSEIVIAINSSMDEIEQDELDKQGAAAYDDRDR